MRIREITDYLESLAPLNFQESYDNSGLLVGHPADEVDKALIALDCTEEVVEEAIELGAKLIIAHHPIVFSGLKRFNGSNYVERTVIKAIKHDVAIYAIHTNLDAIEKGVNSKIGGKLGLTNLQILKPKGDLENVGSGMIGELPEAMKATDFFQKIKKEFEVPFLKHTKLLHQEIRKVAFCGGSGSFLLEEAKQQGAEVFISSDFKYHQYFDAEESLVIVDIGHYEAENCTKDLIYEILTEKFPNFTLHFSRVNTNPVIYF